MNRSYARKPTIRPIRAVDLATMMPLLVFIPTSVVAQFGEIGGGNGNSVGTDIPSPVEDPSQPVAFAEDEKEKFGFRLVPAFIDADGADLAGAEFRVGYKMRDEFGVRLRRISPDDQVPNLNQQRYRYKRKLHESDAFSFAGSVTYTDLEDSWDQLGFAVSFSWELSEQLSISSNLSWEERDFEDELSTDDFGANIRFRQSLSSESTISVDYTFKNNINRDDAVILELSYKNLFFGGNNDAIYAGYVISF